MFNISELDNIVNERKAQLKRVDRTAWRYNKKVEKPSRRETHRKFKHLEHCTECLGA